MFNKGLISRIYKCVHAHTHTHPLKRLKKNLNRKKKARNSCLLQKEHHKRLYSSSQYMKERFLASSVIRKVKNKASTTFYYADTDLKVSNSNVVKDVEQRTSHVLW